MVGGEKLIMFVALKFAPLFLALALLKRGVVFPELSDLGLDAGRLSSSLLPPGVSGGSADYLS
jgi:hypothetical protein